MMSEIFMTGVRDVAEVVACAPRPAGDWRNLGSMSAFVLMAWAFVRPAGRARGLGRR